LRYRSGHRSNRTMTNSLEIGMLISRNTFRNAAPLFL